MNANQIINMVIRMVMRQVIGRGINAGIARATRGRKESGPDGQKTVANARKTMKLGRRMGRF
ncbi:ribosomal protein S13 [Roseovarius sp. MBR-78]|jgi:ribosomal protein S13|uniref:hypothetical protein n=1 Tax=Roseovarius sp. MBR-78 TaxID=3156460 RepID=UPI00339B8E5A